MSLIKLNNGLEIESTEATERGFVPCEVEGVWYPISSCFKTPTGYISQVEFESGGWGTCADDGLAYPEDELVVVRDRHGATDTYRLAWADRNARECQYDNVMSTPDRGREVEDLGWVCRYSLENGELCCCDSCRTWVRSEDSCDGQCPSCYADNDSSRLIQSSCCRDYPRALGKGDLKYGIELEVEVKGSEMDDCAQRVLTSLGDDFVILKEDGSLNHGFEIVTAPATLGEHIIHWTPFLDSTTAKRGLRSWDPETCGMHVHVSRKALSQLQIGKLLVMINCAGFSSFVNQMAGRSPNSYCHRNPKKVSDARKSPDSRYQAINLAPVNTIEFRIFRGTLVKGRLLSNLEFVDACVAYTSPAGESLRALDNLNNFINFVAKQRKRWPHLTERMVQLGHMVRIKAAPTAPVSSTPAMTPELAAVSE